MTPIVFFVLATPALQAPADLAADPRLHTPIQIVAPSVTLEELVAEVSAKANVPIKVAQDIQDTLVVVRWKGDTRGLMQTLAKYFDWTWTQESAGYRLVRTEQQQRAEEEQWRRERLAVPDLVRRLFEGELKKASEPLTEADLARAREIQRAMQAIRTKPQPDWMAHQQLVDELNALLLRTNHLRNLALLAVVEASDEALLQLADGRSVAFADRPNPRQFPLGPKARALAQTMVREYSELSKLPQDQLGEFADRVLPPLTNPFSESDVKQVVVRVEIVPVFPNLSFPSLAKTTIVSKDDRSLVSSYVNLPYETRGLSYTPESDPVLRALSTPVSRLETRPAIEASEAERRTEPCATFGHLLVFLADKSSRNLVAEASDAYINYEVFDRLSGETIGELMLDMARVFRLEVEDGNGTLLVRQAVAPMWARRMTMPRRILRPLLQEVEPRWGVSIDRLSAIAERLTDEQLAFWYAPVGIALGLNVSPTLTRTGERSHIRFWASLPPTTRQHLLAGGTVTYGELPPQARSHLLSIADDRSGTLDPFVATAALPPSVRGAWEDVFNAGMSAARLERRVVDTTVRYPRDLPYDTEIRVVRTEIPAIGRERSYENVTWKEVRPAWLAGHLDVAEEARIPNEGLYVGVAEVQVLGILLPDGMVLLSEVTGTHVTENARPLRWDELPEAVRRAIEEGRQQARGGGG